MYDTRERTTEQGELYDASHLTIGGCDAVELAKTYGTPLIVYDERRMREMIQSLHRTLADTGLDYHITYASKAFCTVAMCQLAANEGCGIDVVSGGELYTALTAGVPASAIHMHGNNKTHEELVFAVDAQIGLIIVDNFTELAMLSDIARLRDVTIDVLLRVAPGVSAHTHEYISTGQQDSKFGFDYESGQAAQALRTVLDTSHIRCIGLHAHIGSQIFETQGFVASIARLADLYAQGVTLGLPFSVLNAGGGFGIAYTDADHPVPIQDQVRAIAEAVRSAFVANHLTLPQVWIEPGRSIVGPAGTTVYTVGSQKRIPGVRNYLAVDGGMTDNPRLALYGASYQAMLANRADESPTGEVWSIAGKCCESGDMVIWDAKLPSPQPGDVLAVFATGAYNYSMASHYNRIPKPAVVFVNAGRAQLVVARETWADMARMDRSLQSY